MRWMLDWKPPVQLLHTLLNIIRLEPRSQPQTADILGQRAWVLVHVQCLQISTPMPSKVEGHMAHLADVS